MLGQARAGSPTAPGPGHPSARGFVPHSGSSASTERGLRPAGGVVLEPGSHPTPQNLSPHLGREVAPGEPTLIPAGCRRAWQRPGPAPGATEWSEPAHRGEGSGPGLLAPGPPAQALPTPSPCGRPRTVHHAHHLLSFGLWPASLLVPHAPTTPPTGDLGPGAGWPPSRLSATPPLGRWARTRPLPPPSCAHVPAEPLAPPGSEPQLTSLFPRPYEITVVT